MTREESQPLLVRTYEIAPIGSDDWAEARLSVGKPASDAAYPWDFLCDWSLDGADLSLRGTGHGGDDVDAVLNALWDANGGIARLLTTHVFRWAGGEGAALPVGLVEFPPRD